MSDLFADKAADFEALPLPRQISEGIGAALRARVILQPHLEVMDFGAGTGLLTGRVAPHVASVVAVDVSPAMLAQLRAKPELLGRVDVVCQDLTEAPLGRSVDLVVSAMAMHHVRDTAALLRALHAHLRPGGRVALADLDTEPGTFHPADIEGVFHHGFDRESFAKLLGDAGFVEIDVATACTVEKEGVSYGIFLATATRPPEVPSAG